MSNLNDGVTPEEFQESEDLRDRMSTILRNTADALHGGPLEDGYWSWHDLPTLATQLRESNERLTGNVRDLGYDNTQLKDLVVEQKTVSENPNRDEAYLAHLTSARAMGITPLDFNSFKAEDKRIYTEWQRRRHGVDTAVSDHAKTLDKFSQRRQDGGLSNSPGMQPRPTTIPIFNSFGARVRAAWGILRRGWAA